MDLQAAAVMARTLMDANRCSGVRFAWNRRTSSFGRCLWRADGSVTIELSAPLTAANDVDVVKSVVLHEIAHAHAGMSAGHGPAWVAICLALGGDGQPCKTFGENGVKPPMTGYISTCAKCGNVAHMAKMPTRRRSCSKCHPGRFDLAHVLTWVHQKSGVDHGTHKPTYPRLFTLDNVPRLP